MTTTTVLVAVEDDAMRTFLADNLTADAFEVLAAHNSREALVKLNSHRGSAYAVVDVNGATRSLIEAISDKTYVIALGSNVDELDRIRKLDAGADDVIAKPFSYPELLARLRAIHRRADGGYGMAVLTVGDLVIEKRSRRVTVRGEAIHLSNFEYQLLTYLAAEPTRVFTKLELLRDIWGFAGTTTRTLDSHACRLRGKLGLHGDRYIVNVWGVGYRLVDVLPDTAAAA